jgi:predicted RNA-binding Zn-ribbon protein involved in translation (DUF1610 family)
MNEQLEKLIDFALADGILTDKEKEVLYRKANEFGVDQDEFEMVLEAKLHQVQKEAAQSAVPQKSNKEGDIKKCPSCGAPVQSFNTTCPDCGHEFRNTQASKSIKEFFNTMNSAPPETQAGIISNFPVPNTKEDIFEFLSMAMGNCATLTAEDKMTYRQSMWTGMTYRPELAYKESEIRAWQSKVKSVIQKGKFSFTDEDSISTIANFEQQFIQVMKANKWKKTWLPALIGGGFALTLILCFLFLPSMSADHDKGIENEKARLEKILDGLNKSIDNKNYDSALIRASELKWEYTDSYSSTDTDNLIQAWDEKRENITETIKGIQKSTD